MTKLPRGIQGKDVVRALKKEDWQVIRIKGSHYHLAHEDYPDRIITVPCHPKPLNPQILHNILRLAELGIDKFKSFL